MIIKEVIWEEIKKEYNAMKCVTFAHLQRTIKEGWKGDRALEWGDIDSNLVMWTGMSQEAIDSILELRDEKKIILYQVSYFFYATEGAALGYPIAKKIDMNYKEPHWLVTVIKVAE